MPKKRARGSDISPPSGDRRQKRRPLLDDDSQERGGSTDRQPNWAALYVQANDRCGEASDRYVQMAEDLQQANSSIAKLTAEKRDLELALASGSRREAAQDSDEEFEASLRDINSTVAMPARPYKRAVGSQHQRQKEARTSITHEEPVRQTYDEDVREEDVHAWGDEEPPFFEDNPDAVLHDRFHPNGPARTLSDQRYFNKHLSGETDWAREFWKLNEDAVEQLKDTEGIRVCFVPPFVVIQKRIKALGVDWLVGFDGKVVDLTSRYPTIRNGHQWPAFKLDADELCGRVEALSERWGEHLGRHVNDVFRAPTWFCGYTQPRAKRIKILFPWPATLVHSDTEIVECHLEPYPQAGNPASQAFNETVKTFYFGALWHAHNYL